VYHVKMQRPILVFAVIAILLQALSVSANCFDSLAPASAATLQSGTGGTDGDANCCGYCFCCHVAGAGLSLAAHGSGARRPGSSKRESAAAGTGHRSDPQASPSLTSISAPFRVATKNKGGKSRASQSSAHSLARLRAACARAGSI
jgi:hypothetical protein